MDSLHIRGDKNYGKQLEKVPFSTDGFVFESDEKIGNSPEHMTGLVYLQEPSSMLAVCSSGIETENRPLKVLDLCASPGGKSGQIASRISSDSVLFSNEIIASRAGILNSNIERLGFKNVVSFPFIIILPDVGSSSFKINFINVDFPDPDVPTKKANSPLSINRVKSFSLYMSSYARQSLPVI